MLDHIKVCKERIGNVYSANGAGVYFFYNHQKEIVYIGRSKDLSKRLLSHFLQIAIGDTFYDDIEYVSVEHFNTDEIASHYEVAFIDFYKPIKNKIQIPYAQWLKTIPSSLKFIVDKDEVQDFVINWELPDVQLRFSNSFKAML